MRISSKYCIILLSLGFALNPNNSDIYDNSWAVIIGINNYKNAPLLNYAVQDAESISNLLVMQFKFPESNIKMLINEQATNANIRETLYEITQSAKEKDRIVIFFAGHGQTLDLFKGGELGYLLPEDADPNNLYLTSLPMDELKRISNMSAAKHILFLVDACYGGLAAVESRGLPTKTPGYLEKITRDMGRHIITAGGRGEEVIEAPVWGHSAFTKNLISGLENWMADSDADGIITASELGVYLQKKVTIDSENRQTPQSRKLTYGEGEFIFINAQPKIDETENEISNNSEVVAQILL